MNKKGNKKTAKKIINKGDNKSTNMKGFIIFIIVVFLLFLSLYISNNKFREIIDINILRKVVKEEKLKEIYENINTQNIFLSSKNIHVLNSGEMKNYDRNGTLISSNILGIGSAVSSTNGDYMAIGEKDGRKIFLFEKGKLKWEREVEVNIHNVYINKSGKMTVIGNSSMYNSIITLIDEEGNQYLKKYFTTKYASKAQISENNKYLVIALADYVKIKISSEIEIIDIEKAVKDEQGAVIKTYNEDELILDIAVLDNEETIVKYENSIYLVNKDEKKKIHDINDDILFVSIQLNGGFAEVNETKSNLFTQSYELKLYDKFGSNIGVLLLDDSIPKNLYASTGNILVEMPQNIIIASDIGWLKKKYSSRRNFIDVKISEGIVAIIYADRIAIIPI